MLLPLLLAALLQAPAVRAGHDLGGYLALASRYGSGQRIAALRELREWRLSELDAAVSALRHRGTQLRAATAEADDIDFRVVEWAVLLHAEAGLLALALGADSSVDAHWHLRASVGLYDFSHAAAARLRERASSAGNASSRESRREPPPEALRVRERIAARDYYVALASTSLAFGVPLTAQAFAREAVRLAPLDGEVHLLSGCVAVSLAEVFALRHQDADAGRSRREAEKALRDALAIDPGLLEARLRLGKLLLDERRAIEAEPLLSRVEERTADERQRYLARLFLGRLGSRRGQPEQAARCYERALEAWPDSQAARFGLAQLLERSAGPSAADEQVAATLAASQRPERAADPWWTYPFGPPGLSKTVLDRLWGSVMGR